MELDLGFLLAEQRKRRARLQEGRKWDSLHPVVLLQVTPAVTQKRGLLVLHCNGISSRAQA